MDWRRAKTILILAFLLLDSFLTFQLWTSKQRNLEVVQQEESSTSSFQDLVKSRNIKLNFELPTDTPEMYYLNIRYEDFRQKNIDDLPNQNVRINGTVLESHYINPLAGLLSPMKELPKAVGDTIFYAGEYELDPLQKSSDHSVYLQHWDNYPFFGAILDLNIVDNKIVGYRQTHFQVVNKGSGKKVISAMAATRTLIESGLIKNGETIHSIDLGYYGNTYDAEIQVIAPVWRISHGNGQIQYINGITGVIEKNPALSK